LAVEKATENITQSEVEELSKLHAKFISAEANQERLEAQSLNRRIHFMIYDKANMPMLLSSILNLWAKMGPILRVYYSERIDVTIGAPDHLNLFEALDANDCSRAVAAVQADIIHGCSAIGNYIRELEGS
jgi:DNA-binding GntR family transcriptional regulator